MTHRLQWIRAAALGAALLAPAAASAQCVGDCSGSGAVSISNLILGVNISLGASPISACPAFDPDGGGTVTIAELIQAVNNALGGCPATPTVTVAPPTGTATPLDTNTPTPAATATNTAAATVTDTAPPTATETAAPTATETAAPSSTATAEPTLTDTAAPTATAEASPTSTETAAATPTDPVASETPTATPEQPSATPTATFTPTSGSSAVCGNGVLEPGETCQGCPADCVVGTCASPGAPTQAFIVDLVQPLGFQPTTATILLGYDSTVLSLPGTATATSVRQRIVAPPPVPQAFTPNDLEYGVRVLVSRNVPLGTLFTATFDRCGGAPAPTLADIACSVESCAAGGSGVPGCTCSVRLP